MPFIRDVSANYHSDKPSECYACRYTCMVHVWTYIAFRLYHDSGLWTPEDRDILDLYCISSETDICSSNQHKEEYYHRKDFMITLHERMLPIRRVLNLQPPDHQSDPSEPRRPAIAQDKRG